MGQESLIERGYLIREAKINKQLRNVLTDQQPEEAEAAGVTRIDYNKLYRMSFQVVLQEAVDEDLGRWSRNM